MEDFLNEKAKTFFNIDYIFPYQRLIINSVLSANNFYGEEYKSEFLKHQISILPTGAGKSLCFMLPATILEKPVLIIFPLLSLMEDQRRRIEETGLTSFVLKGGLERQDIEKNFDLVEKGKIKFIITNPEMLQQNYIIKKLENIEFSNIVVDEVHTVAQWGDTFRSSYLGLKESLKNFRYNFFSAFTATASQKIIDRIREILFSGEQYNLIYGNPDRENIIYNVVKTDSKKGALLNLMEQNFLPTIIFCRSRSRVKDIAKFLLENSKNDKIFFYHAGLTKEEKKDIENWFLDCDDGILVSTCAYGMGVDKKNIRSVIHYDLPTSIEAYLQESGRAGRDRQTAEAFLLFSNEDLLFLDKIDNKNLKDDFMKLIEYANLKSCRRDFLVNNLGKEVEFCNGCDICNKKKSDINFFKMIRSKNLLNSETIIKHLKGEYGKNILDSIILKGKFFSLFKNLPLSVIEEIVKNNRKKKVDFFKILSDNTIYKFNFFDKKKGL